MPLEPRIKKLFGLFGLTCLLLAGGVSLSHSQEHLFPQEPGFVQREPTVPNGQLDFSNDANESCCLRDYQPNATPSSLESTLPSPASAPASSRAAATTTLQRDPTYLTECSQYEEIPVLANHSQTPPDFQTMMVETPRTIGSYSTHISSRIHEGFFINNPTKTTTNFHIGGKGGQSIALLEEVSNYSVCMAGGGNVVAVANTDNGSIMTYNGNDHIYLAGNNTNMLTRTGTGDDVIEIRIAQPLGVEHPGETFRGEKWRSYVIYKTALSGGPGQDSVVIQDTPSGTKWCHIGGYYIFGEYFYVVEFALPPSVTEGPRRQRINIGRSVEHVVYRGRKYTLREFLTHGSPADEVAQSVPVDGALPYHP